MKGFLGLLLLLAVVIVGVGLYRGWFEVSTQKTEDKSSVSITMDKNKIQEDEEKVKEKVQDLGHQIKDKTADKPAKKD
jgi:predicted negative regulator of RcsB-dependent stress response